MLGRRRNRAIIETWQALYGGTGTGEAYVLHRTRPGGRHDALCVVLAPAGGGISSAVYLADMSDPSLAELLAVVRSGTRGHARRVPLAQARLAVARAVLATRIRGRSVPAALEQGADACGLEHTLATVSDVYACPACGSPLPGELQLALARGQAGGYCAVLCRGCLPDGPVTFEPLPLNLVRAQLMLDAGEPLRAMEIASAADDLATVDVERVRGWAQLLLGNATQAVIHLRRALTADPTDQPTRALLIRASAELEIVAAAQPVERATRPRMERPAAPPVAQVAAARA